MYYPRWLFSSSLNASASTHSQAHYQTLKQQVEWEQTEIVGSSLLQVGKLNSNFAPSKYAIAIKFLSLR
jgi:hypothetical protein